ncbi:MAG: hypothetical protein WC480_01790 [Patescibacteria group bacterium]
MTPERWQELKAEAKIKFTLDSEEVMEFEDGPGTVEILEFNSPLGKIRLEYAVRPLVLDKKTTTSRRIGAGVKVDYVYSPDEFTYKLTTYKWNDGLDDWEKISGEMFT